MVIKNENIQLAAIKLQSNAISMSNDGRVQISSLENVDEIHDLNGDALIENIYNSKLVISGNLNSLRIKNSLDSKIEAKSICAGSIYIENVRGGMLKIAGDQLRIHNCVNVDIYIFTKSSCILEDCEDLRIYANKDAANTALIGIGDGSYWKCVQDFGFNPEGSFTLIESD